VLIAGPNLSIDRTIGVERFDLGHIHRVDRVEARVGGGGANAARVARLLGASARLITIVPEFDARVLAEAFARDGIEVDSVRCKGQTRIATILREPLGRMSILNEPGPGVDARAWQAFTKLASDGLRQGDVLLCSGSLPEGVLTPNLAEAESVLYGPRAPMLAQPREWDDYGAPSICR
jgi:fructose-1-phosphate kinase PfkB-like protein